MPPRRDPDAQNRDAALRSNLKKMGMDVPGDRVRLVNAVYAGCTAMLRQVTNTEKHAILVALAAKGNKVVGHTRRRLP